MFFGKKYVVILLFLSKVTFGQNLVRGPYLQQPTTNSIVIRWRTEQNSASKIIFGISQVNLNQSVNDNTLTNEHIVKLSNLEANTKYFYEVWSENTLLSKSNNNYFITAPNNTSKRPIRIWAGGDFADISNQVYLTNQTQVRDSYLNYSKNFNTDLWLWLGDAGYGGDRDNTLQNSIFDFYGPQIMNHVPFAAALGNHEFDEDQANQQKTRDVNLLKITSPAINGEAGGIPSGTKAFYSFDYGNTHFINLDSYGMDEGIYRLYNTKGAQYQWLIRDLKANKSLWTVVFFHHPPYTKRGHDSDIEEELRLLRETLVPVFDTYKVDLVLNGHSHIYERSYLIQDHLAQSQFFDPSYQIVNKNSGKYLKNEPPIINKTNGTTYVVAGTFGRLEPILALRLNDPQHPTSYYSNLITGGSLALKIEDNRLDCEWLCADGVVRDRFTMFKNVNKVTKINLEYGEKVEIKASWPGNYVWSNGVKNKAEIEISPLNNTTYSVKDSLGFLEDKFEITVAAQPIIEAKLSENFTYCTGKTIQGFVEITNTNFEKWKYKIELSDKDGSFSKPLVSQEITEKQFKINIPKNAPEGNFYRLRIVPNSDLFKLIESPNFVINIPATVGFTNESIIQFQSEITLNLNFKGTFPIEYLVSFENKSLVTNQEKVEFKLKPISSENYEILSVKNVCSEGEITNRKVTVLAPLSLELEQFGIKIYPNPTSNSLVIEIGTAIESPANIFNSAAQLSFSTKLLKGKNYIDLSSLSKGLYFVEFVNNGKKIFGNFIIQ